MPPVDEVLETEVHAHEGMETQPLTPEEQAEAESAFLSVFEDDAAPKEKVSEETESEAKPAVAAPVSAAAEPTLAKITDAQWQQVLTDSKSGGDLRAAIEKMRGDAFGKIGGLERTLRQIQDATPVGQPIQVAGDDLAEFKVEFPDLADKLAKDLTKVLSKFKGTAGVDTQPPVDFDERVNAKVEQAKLDASLELLDTMHEDWRDITGPVNSDTEYRRWLNSQPEEYKRKVLETRSGVVVGKSITMFKKATEQKAADEAKKPKVNAAEVRAQRLRESVSTRGSAPAPGGEASETEESAFHKAVNS